MSYGFNPATQSANGEATYKNGYDKTVTNSFSSLKSDSKIGTVSLYYSYMWDDYKTLAINVVNSMGKSWSKSQLGIERNDERLDDIVETSLNNNSYMFSAEAYYTCLALGGQLSFGDQYSYTYLRQKYLGVCSKPIRHFNSTTLGMYWRVKEFSIYPYAILTITDQRTQDNHFTKVSPTYYFYSDWRPSRALRGVFVQLTLNSTLWNPPSSMLSSSPTYLDFNFISIGNPKLESFIRYDGKISLSYNFNNTRNRISYVNRFGYSPNYYGAVLDVVNSTPVLTFQNYKYGITNTMYLNGVWYPFPWLEVNPYLELYI